MLLLALPLLLAAAGVARADECTRQAVTLENRHGLPAGLLHAVALAESGFNGRPQPFALRIGGQSLYPETIEAARRELRDGAGALKRGVTAGCMQLSLTWHGHLFQPPERILEPEANIRRAARYLLHWRQHFGNWTEALGRYQGGTPEQRRAYACRIWNHLRVLAPASAALIDARACHGMKRPAVDPAGIELARSLRRRLTTPPGPPLPRPIAVNAAGS